MFSKTTASVSACVGSAGLIGTSGTFGSVPATFYLINEKGGRDTQTSSYLVNVRKSYVSLTALNPSHVRSVNAATFGQFFLRYSFLHAQCAHALAELTCGGIRH